MILKRNNFPHHSFYTKLFLVLVLAWFALDINASCKPCFDPERCYDLNSLVDMALSYNPSTRVVWAQIKAACANVGIQDAAYSPTITGNLNINDNARGGGNSNIGFGANANNPFTSNNTVSGGSSEHDVITYGGYITINWLLYDFGVRKNNVRAAIYQWLATRYNGDEEIQQIVAQVQQSYFETLGYAALVKADQKSVQEARYNLQVAKGLHDQGVAVIGDVYQAESALANAQLVLDQAQGNYIIAKGQLNSAIGLPVTTCLKLKQLPTDTESKHVLGCMFKLLEVAEHKRPDLIAARESICANRALLKATIAQQYPVVQLTANAGHFVPKHVPGGGGFHNATLNISFPIINEALRYQIKQARANLQQAEAQALVLSNQVDLQVWQAYYTLETAAKTIVTTQVLLKSSQVAASQAAGQYRAGVGTILNMLTTQATLESARGQYIQARMNWYISLAQLYLALGTLVKTPCS